MSLVPKLLTQRYGRLKNPLQQPLRVSQWGSGSSGPSSLVALTRAYWNFAETSGDYLDSSGNNLSLTVNGAPTRGAAGPIGSAITFSANTQWLERASESLLQLSGLDWTINFWMKTTSSSAGAIYGKFNASAFPINNADAEYRGEQSTSPAVRTPYHRMHGSAATGGAKSTAVGSNVWAMATARFDCTTGAIHVQTNAETPVTNSLTSLPINVTAYPFYIGKNYSGSSNFRGSLAEFGIFASAAGAGGFLSDAQITALYNGGAGATYPFTGIP